jgi:hypothetical protein
MRIEKQIAPIEGFYNYSAKRARGTGREQNLPAIFVFSRRPLGIV